jgi:hypothetical protein
LLKLIWFDGINSQYLLDCSTFTQSGPVRQNIAEGGPAATLYRLFLPDNIDGVCRALILSLSE